MSDLSNKKRHTDRFREFIRENADSIVDILIRNSRSNGLIKKGVIIKHANKSYIKTSVFMGWLDNIFYDDSFDEDDE